MEHRKKKGQETPRKDAGRLRTKGKKKKFQASISSTVKKELKGLLAYEERPDPKKSLRGKRI